MGRPPFLDQFLPAEASIAIVMLAVLFGARLPGAKTALLATSIVLATFAPFAAGLVPAIPLSLDVDRGTFTLRIAASLATLATAFPRPSLRTLGALAGLLLMHLLCRWMPSFTPALTIAELTWVALVIGLEIGASARITRPDALAPPAVPRRTRALEDLALFVGSFALAALVCDRLLERYTLSGDEWANTFQADVFAHFRAYASSRACESVFKNWWVFERDGRLFAQYTPGWPLVMAPFQRLGAVWLACPFVFGVTSVGVARLARRIAAHGLVGLRATSARCVRWAGMLAAVAAVACPSALLNGASRYPHTMVCACFAWSVESLFALAEARSRRARAFWGITLGTASSLMVAVRPLDGASIGLGLAPVFVYLMARRALPLPGVVAAAFAFAFWAALTLVILRLQLGKWFTTGYSMSPLPTTMGIPPVTDLAFAFRIDKGTGWWWPCAVPLVPLGLLAARGRALRVAWALALGAIAHSIVYAMIATGRDGSDSGYGPRFHLPILVPMAVAAGIALAVLAERAWPAQSVQGSRANHGGFRDVSAALSSIGAWVVGTILIAVVVYPWWGRVLHERRATARAIERTGVHHAVVVVHDDGTLGVQAWDLTQNIPSESNPDVLIITDRDAAGDYACARKTYGDRSWYEARERRTESGDWGEVDLAPLARF